MTHCNAMLYVYALVIGGIEFDVLSNPPSHQANSHVSFSMINCII